jgi:Ran GTPase-activating protein (RanGAP) involved in mRNA processing and transport
VLSLKNNSLGTKEAGKVLGEMLKVNSVLKELDLSDNTSYHGVGDPAGFAQELALGIKDNGALLVLSLKDNRLLTAEAGKNLSDMIATNTVLNELDLSSNSWKDCYGDWQGDGPGFARELAVGIRDNGALIKLDISGNYIGATQEGDLQRICVASVIESVF